MKNKEFFYCVNKQDRHFGEKAFVVGLVKSVWNVLTLELEFADGSRYAYNTEDFNSVMPKNEKVNWDEFNPFTTGIEK